MNILLAGELLVLFKNYSIYDMKGMSHIIGSIIYQFKIYLFNRITSFTAETMSFAVI